MKKRPKQHEIGDDGVTLFQEALRKANKNSKLTATFNEQIKNDYGVDGELQFFEDGRHTCNVFKVQIKSTKSLKIIHNNTQISFKLDNDEIKFLYELNVPSALIVCNTTDEKVFWHPILRDKTFIKAAETTGEQKKTTTLHLSLENKIMDGSLQSFYKYFTDMQNEGLLRKSSLNTMSRSMELMKAPGLDLTTRDKESPLSPNAIISIETERYAYDYCPNKKYGEDGLLSAKTKLKFDTKSKSQVKTYQKLQNILEGNIGEVYIPAKNIVSTHVYTGIPIWDKSFSELKLVGLSISNKPIKRSVNIFLSNKRSKFIIKAEEYFSNGIVYINSIDAKKQPFRFTAELNIESANAQSKMHIGLNYNFFKNYESIIRYLDFLLMNDSITFGGFAPDTGEEMKIATISLPQNVEDGLEYVYHICRSFVDIQEKYNLVIPYKELNTIQAKDEYEINKVIKLFELENVPIDRDITLTITMKEGANIDGLVEGYQFRTLGDVCIPLFGTILYTDKLRQDISGVVSKITKQGGGQYKILAKDVSMRLKKI
jgi:hypothetical protein cdivTM_01606